MRKAFEHFRRWGLRSHSSFLLLLVLVAVGDSAYAETRQRIDYSTVWLGIDQYKTDAELFTTPTDDNIDQVSPIFWVKVSQTVRSLINGKVKSEIISIREFPTIEYRKILRQLKSVRNLNSSTVYRELNLCDSAGHVVRLDRRTQSVIDICGPDPGDLNRVDGRMMVAVGMLKMLVRKTIRHPDTRYRRR